MSMDRHEAFESRESTPYLYRSTWIYFQHEKQYNDDQATVLTFALQLSAIAVRTSSYPHVHALMKKCVDSGYRRTRETRPAAASAYMREISCLAQYSEGNYIPSMGARSRSTGKQCRGESLPAV